MRIWPLQAKAGYSSLPEISTTRPIVTTYDPVRDEMISLTTELIDQLDGYAGSLTPANIWKSQPNVRAVVEFLAHNLSQLGLRNFVRVSDTDRKRTTTSAAALLLRSPAPFLSGFDLVVGLVSDLLMFDEALWIVTPSETRSGWLIRPVPVGQIVKRSGSRYDAEGMTFTIRLGDGRAMTLAQDRVVYFGGYTPDHDDRPTARLNTLRDEIKAQVDAAKFRAQMWRNGLRTGQVVTRPAGGPKWSGEARAQFIEDLRAYADNGSRAGRPLLLEDGMTLDGVSFNARDAQWLEAVQLSFATVCRMFQVNPSMMGSTGGISYANVKEFRKMLYGETLGPIVRRIEDAINAFLLPKVGADPGEYAEFNIKEKLAGSFEEEAAVLSTSTGVPWMTRNEARATQNLPGLPGGDELMTPLNYQVGSGRPGGKSGPVRLKSSAVQVKGAPDDASERALTNALADFFKRQRSVVLAALASKAALDWWDADRWDKELSADLYAVAMQVTQQVAGDVLDSIGYSPDEYDLDRTAAFLKAVAESRATMINGATLARIEDVLAWTPGEGQNEDDRPTPAGVFDDATDGQRAGAMVSALGTTLAAFATVEAGKQVGAATKTWIAGPNPRSTHAAMDGETVPVGDTFSNGADWPGDPVLGADEVAGCNCSVTLTIG